MTRSWSVLALSVSMAIAPVAAESPSTPPETSTRSEHSSGGLKGLKNAARKDPTAFAVNLTSPEARDRGQAAQALGNLGSPALPAMPSLLEVITDFATYQDEAGAHVVSVEAAQAIRQIDPKTALPVKTLTHLTRVARAPAEHLLVKGGWVARCGAQSEALMTLSALGPLAQVALPEVARLNHMPCTEGRALETALAIGPIAPELVPHLMALLNDADPQARRSVVEYIGEAHVTGGAAALGRAMNDSSSFVRLSALEALEKLHPEGEGRVPLVKPFLQEESPEIRRQSLRLLLQLAPDSPVTLALLKERLKDSDPSLVLESAQTIARIAPRNPELLDSLIRLASGPDPDIALQAAELLKSSGSHETKVTQALEPYRARERQQKIERALLTSSAEERAKNARTLRVNAIRIALGIKEEQPDQGNRTFSTGAKKLFCWTSVSAGAAPAALRHIWYLDGKPVYEATLVAAEPASRVWSSHRIKAGKWHVDVAVPGSSEPLASASFTVFKE